MAGEPPERETTMNSMNFYLAEARRQDLLQQAERHRLVAAARRQQKVAAAEARAAQQVAAPPRPARVPLLGWLRLGHRTA